MKRILILGAGSNAAAVVTALAMAGEAVASVSAEPVPKFRNPRGPSMVEPGPYGASRQRAQWKDETQRRGRQR
jgi:hypothetical protein